MAIVIINENHYYNRNRDNNIVVVSFTHISH